MGVRHFLEIDDLTPEELSDVLNRSKAASGGDLGAQAGVLSGKGVAMVFEHPSARTRNAAEMAVVSLGGHPVTVRGEEVGIDVREQAEDIARTLGCFHAAIMARVARHSTLERFVAALDGNGWGVPVVNLLSEVGHPTQALADLLVMSNHWGSLSGRRVAWIGDANNVARSLVLAGAMVGMEVVVAAPPGFGLGEDDIARAAALGAPPTIASSPAEAADGADALYTDVWVSMGQEDEGASRRRSFRGWTIDEALFSHASPGALLMHCLPAHRGEEVTEEVLEGPRSVVWDQARARKDVLVGLLAFLFAGLEVAEAPPSVRP